MFRYLVGTTDLGIWYINGFHFDLVAYYDTGYVGDTIEIKNTTRACQFLGQTLVI